MNLIISDTSPLNYLGQINCLEILPGLFPSVLIPPAVQSELLHARTPTSARSIALHLPPWLTVRAPTLPVIDGPLGLGEREAITLCLELKARILLLDDAEGRATARRLALQPIGTIGLLRLAAKRKLIDLPTATRHLRATNFIASPQLWRLLEEEGA